MRPIATRYCDYRVAAPGRRITERLRTGAARVGRVRRSLVAFRGLLLVQRVAKFGATKRVATGVQTRIAMLHYAVVFLVIALIAAVFGFGGIAAGAAGIAKVLFVVFLIGAVVAFLMNGRSRI